MSPYEASRVGIAALVAAMHSFCFFFNDTATTEIYTLSLHDALPIYPGAAAPLRRLCARLGPPRRGDRSEEHTSELQSRQYLVCRLLLEKKKNSGKRFRALFVFLRLLFGAETYAAQLLSLSLLLFDAL